MKIAFDPRLRRPACPQLQAALGCSVEFAEKFPSEAWLISKTSNMGVFEVAETMTDWLVTVTKNALLRRSVSEAPRGSGHVPRCPTMDEQEARMGSVSRDRTGKNMNWGANESQRRIDLRGRARR